MKPGGHFRRRLGLACIAAVLAALLGYALAPGYFWHIGLGHMRIILARQDIDQVLASNGLSQHERRKLKLVQQVQTFAQTHLALPPSHSYTSLARINRATAGWNVYAAPEFSVEPHRWCFPLVGCVVYRGYFAKRLALSYAATMRQQGLDSYVGAFSGYSSLGYFADPLLSSQLAMADYQLVALVIHELAHQRLYLPGQSQINEAFAKLVEHQGLLAFAREKHRQDLLHSAQQSWQRSATRADLVLQARRELGELYASGIDAPAMRLAKAERLAQLHNSLCPTCPPVDATTTSLNNAFLVPYATYHQQYQQMEKLFAQSGRDFAGFYRLVEQRYGDAR